MKVVLNFYLQILLLKMENFSAIPIAEANEYLPGVTPSACQNLIDARSAP